MIAVDDDQCVVLVQNSYSPGVWRLPGGGLHRHESFRAAAIREAEEEAGVVANPASEVTLRSIHLRHIGNWIDHVAIFSISNWDEEDKETWEISDRQRFPVSSLPSNIESSHRRRIEEWRTGSPPGDTW